MSLEDYVLEQTKDFKKLYGREIPEELIRQGIEKISKTDLSEELKKEWIDLKIKEKRVKYLKEQELLKECEELYSEGLTEVELLNPIDISSLKEEELNSSLFHFSLKKYQKQIIEEGLKSSIGLNSKGIDYKESIYFSKGIEAVLELQDVWLKWRLNMLNNPLYDKNYDDVRAHKAVEDKKREYYQKMTDWNSLFISEQYKEDIEKLDFLYNYQMLEMENSFYYILELKENEEYLQDEIDTKKVRDIEQAKNGNSMPLKRQIIMYGKYSDNENVIVDKWNMNTLLGKKITIEPERIKQLQTKDGKTDELSIVIDLYNHYKANVPEDKQVKFDLLDDYISYVKKKKTNRTYSSDLDVMVSEDYNNSNLQEKTR